MRSDLRNFRSESLTFKPGLVLSVETSEVLVGRVFALLADANRGFEDEKNVVAAFLDAGNDFGDRFGIGQRLVDRFSEFFHELLQLLIHESPSKSDAADGHTSQTAVTAPIGHCTPARC